MLTDSDGAFDGALVGLSVSESDGDDVGSESDGDGDDVESGSDGDWDVFRYLCCLCCLCCQWCH